MVDYPMGFFKALGIEDGEVIMPAYTCSVVATKAYDNIPRFIDIDLHDYNMNLDLAEEAINEKTRAIIATHTFVIPFIWKDSEYSCAEKSTVKKFGSFKIAVMLLVQNGKENDWHLG